MTSPSSHNCPDVGRVALTFCFWKIWIKIRQSPVMVNHRNWTVFNCSASERVRFRTSIRKLLYFARQEQREQLSSRPIIAHERHRAPYRLTWDVLRINQSRKDIAQLARARASPIGRSGRKLAHCVTMDTSTLGLYYLTRLYLTVSLYIRYNAYRSM